MKGKLDVPVYAKIALDLAARIVRGDLKENVRLSGRSLIASEYQVSPETIRKSFQLLEDMGIVSVHPSRGVDIVSREKASDYIEQHNIGRDFRNLRRELKDLLAERDHINQRIIEMVDQILDINERYRNSNTLYTVDFQIPPESPVIGKSVSETKFWYHTGATVVAVKRAGQMILSPGPDYIFLQDDIVYVTGSPGLSGKIEHFLTGLSSTRPLRP